MGRCTSSIALVLSSLAPAAALADAPTFDAQAAFSAGLADAWGSGRLAATLGAGYVASPIVTFDLVGSIFDRSDRTNEILETHKLSGFDSLDRGQPELLWSAVAAVRFTPIRGSVAVYEIDEPGLLRVDISVGLGLGQSRLRCTPGLELDPETFGRKPDGTPATCRMIDTTRGDDAFRLVYEPNVLRPVGMLALGARFPIFEPLGLRVGVRDWIFHARSFRPGTNEPTLRFQDAIMNEVLFEIGLSALM